MKDDREDMLFSASVVARLPLATFSIGLLVHVEQLSGSYTAAGAVAGALAVAQGAGGPLLGRLVDRRGQTVVLLSSATVAGAGLIAVAMMPAGTPLPALLALAALIGLATPPVGACMRTLIPVLRPGADSRRRAYAADAAATELTWVSGPPLALGLGALAGTGTALTAAGMILIAATALFASSRASRGWQPTRTRRARVSALASPDMRTLVTVMIGVGVVFGATEVAVTASAGPAAGLLLGLWGAGSLAGGVAATRLGGGATDGRRFALLLAALGVGHLLLVAASARVIVAAALIAVAGSMIAPVLASSYAMVDSAAPAGTATEAFAWLATATAIGTAGGAAAGGALADLAGPASGFVLAGAAGLVAAVVAVTRISGSPAPQPAAAV
ncbi:MFS transporter [Actinoplanes aureus]|uniref:MFS transporter n=1 Tax=Actinoplanes aureus TaxID=2792083 RepID=A0A931FYL2_9ACTN|nr:MFS transporter [Actinoplanes aureus]MBG0563715.1 MFS transporter [Actinoplanes aureus]